MRTQTLPLSGLLLASLVVATGCRNCDNLGAVQAAGAIEPPIFEFGPLTVGQTCQAILQVTNHGQEDLSVSGATLKDTTAGAQYTLKKSPTLVRIGGAEDLIVNYDVAGDDGAVQSTGIELQTDDPDSNGILKGLITAIVTTNPVPAAKSQCGSADAPTAPCPGLSFGATQLNGTGITLGVTIVNDGNADMTITAALIDAGNNDFTVESVQQGSTVVQLPITIPAGRSTDCGQPTGTDANKITVNVHYVPTTLGADVDTLDVLTDAVSSDGTPGGILKVALDGEGSEVGISMIPDTINFGQLGEGANQTIDVLVKNNGTSSASVNFACIDLENDGTCEANCTGQPSDSALSGTLTCTVTTSAGTLDSLGFVLAPTDAQDGGDDERHIAVTWAPIAGATNIPNTAVLALHSNILGDKVFTAPLLGGSFGVLAASVASDDTCSGGIAADVCLDATGDPTTFTTWAGEVTVRLTNSGNATVNVSGIEMDPAGAGTINDDYTLGALTSTAIAPGDHADFTVSYDEVAPGADASQSSELTNILVHHDGAGGLETITIDVVPPT